MKSLYNIAGILPAQCRANPNDCGIAWSEHRKVEQVKREDVISVEAPPLTDALTEYLKETMAACMSKLMIMPKLMIDVNPADQGADQTVTTAFTLKPIDPKTIKVGATVRLVGNFFSSQKWSVNFTKYQYYEVIMVDRENRCGMPVMIRNDKGINNWMFGEDLVLVESA